MRLALVGLDAIANDAADHGVSSPPFSGHQPHGPPPVLAILSTIILLT
jgi:hypothetical protein